MPEPTRWKCVCAYDGTTFDGWQSQASGQAIQDVIERSLKKVLKTAVRVHGSGRTDSGVHALAQVFHFDAVWPHGAEKLRRALQTGLPRAIHLKTLRVAPASFHARFQARGKIYHYDLFLGEPDPFTSAYCWALGWELDWAAVEAAARLLRGRHDFKAFSADGGTEMETTVRDLRRLEVRRRGRRVRLTFEADGFLYKMVRSLTGTLVNVGLGKLTPADVGAMLKSGKRTVLVRTAPPQGLFLERVHY
ncbi:MAG: tRNA pseudouridine(38-40) synthase TruA [Candidatus Didemnitutus sp.]|nr:tRNA pseudouridine(38-40) synthase TruA [Candidatus Didemnitutus sp.]